MSTSQKTPFLLEIEQGDDVTIPPGKLAYLEERARNNWYHYVVHKFRERERDGFTKAMLARRLGMDAAALNRLLGAPGNWTISTIAKLLVGISREEIEPSSREIVVRPRFNRIAPPWLADHKEPESAPLVEITKAKTDSTPVKFEVIMGAFHGAD